MDQRNQHAGNPRIAARHPRGADRRQVTGEDAPRHMMNVIIVDDEAASRRTLHEYCDAENDLHVVGEFGDGTAALAAIRETQPHLVFLDIHMDPLNGIELARALDPSHLPSLVFVTAYDTYAIEAFEVSAVDYLLKPFDQERFRRTLNRVRPRHAMSGADERQALLAGLLAQLERSVRSAGEDRPRLLAEFGGHLRVLEAAQVEMIEADRNYVVIRVGKDSFHARSTLQQAELALRSQPMLRISRSCLVNMNYVKEVNRTLRGDFILVLAGGATVTSSEGFRGKVKDYLSTLRIS
jgi:two-component system LytT family response regulator